MLYIYMYTHLTSKYFSKSLIFAFRHRLMHVHLIIIFIKTVLANDSSNTIMKLIYYSLKYVIMNLKPFIIPRNIAIFP